MNEFRETVSRIKDKGGLPDQDYSIGNAEKLRDENPRSFSIPRSEQRRSLKVGDLAKILLEATHSAGPITAERPWIKVIGLCEGGYQVRVDNHLVLFPSLNDVVLTVRPEHIIAVTLPDEYVLPIGKTCLVSRMVQEGGAWPHRLARMPPTSEADSGWRVFAKGEVLNDASEQVSCDALMADYQVLDSLMDEPGHEYWVWDERANEFVRESV